MSADPEHNTTDPQTADAAPGAVRLDTVLDPVAQVLLGDAVLLLFDGQDGMLCDASPAAMMKLGLDLEYGPALPFDQMILADGEGPEALMWDIRSGATRSLSGRIVGAMDLTMDADLRLTRAGADADVSHVLVAGYEQAAPVDTTDAGELAAVAAPVAAETDLLRLPGAGVGLVWMLRQCDIHTLGDLASAQANDLSEKLGVVGQILNVQAWIDFAKTDRAA